MNSNCNYHCSKEFGGVRYCGQGPSYKLGDSIDCSGCAVDPYVHAADGAFTCPSGYDRLTDPKSCQDVAIHGTEYTWSGEVGCSYFWPTTGCFTWSGKVYFSNCNSGRAISVWSHDGICKKQGAIAPTTAPTSAPPLSGCPDTCHSPSCKTGGKFNGGLPLVSGKCHYHCSRKFGEDRYCGSGSDYTLGDGVDCGGCVTGKYVHAGEGTETCPSGYQPLNSILACKAGVVIDGTPYTWGGKSACSYQWPKSGCFSYRNKLYFSLCAISRPLSQYEHYGICEKIVS